MLAQYASSSSRSCASLTARATNSALAALRAWAAFSLLTEPLLWPATRSLRCLESKSYKRRWPPTRACNMAVFVPFLMEASAPRCNNSLHIAMLPASAAHMSGVSPLLVGKSTSARRFTKHLATSMWPWRTAKCKAAKPSSMSASSINNNLSAIGKSLSICWTSANLPENAAFRNSSAIPLPHALSNAEPMRGFLADGGEASAPTSTSSTSFKKSAKASSNESMVLTQCRRGSSSLNRRWSTHPLNPTNEAANHRRPPATVNAFWEETRVAEPDA
mmetsp:Transcript_56157/g.162704  ORF Transcript_56157/g.162704 Transcript_56157/m.162704 type:complete len:275 (+) Transcript_56157:447-1271(+)